MTSYQQTQRTLQVPPYNAPLIISPLRHKTPSLPLIRHSPSLQTLNFHPLGLQPLNSFRAKLHSRNGAERIVEEVDPPPRPLRIKKIRKSPSMPFGSVWDSKSSQQLPRRGPPPPPPSKSFLGLAFPPQPKPRSSSAGVLLADRAGNIPGAVTDISSGLRSDSMRRASSQRHGETKMPGVGMAWLQRPRSARPLSALPPTSTYETPCMDNTDSRLPLCQTPHYHNGRKLSSQMLPTSRNSSGDATAGTSHRSTSYQSTLETTNTPATQDDALGETKKEILDIRRAASTGGNGKKNMFDFRNSNTPTKEPVEGPTDKTPVKGWKEKMFSKDFFTRGSTGAVSPKKEAKTKGRERTNSVSSNTTIKTVQIIPRSPTSIGDSSFTRIDIPSSSGWCEYSNWQSRSSVGAWQLDGHVATSSLAGSKIRSRNILNDSVLGIFEGNVGSMGRTRLKKAGHWRPPTLQLQMEVFAETEKVPISYPGSGNEKVVWVSVELDGMVDKGTESFEGSKIGLDVGVLMDISAYTSSTSFASMKLQAKRLVEAMETSRDRVAVMTFPVGSNAESMPSSRDGVHVLNSSGSVAKQQLMDDIALLGQNKWDIDPAARDVRAAVLASVKKLKGMPLNTARYGTHRHAHLFLLTSKLDVGEIELLPEVFFGEIQIHILGIGALFWPRNEMGASGWCLPTRTLGPRPIPTKTKVGKFEDDMVKSEGVTVEDIIPLLRKAVDLGALQDLSIELRAGENCNILAVMGDLKYNKILPGEKRTLLVQVQVGDMPYPDNEEYDLDGNHEGLPQWVILERQLEATLGELKGRLLSVKANYRHSNFSETTIFSAQRHLEISRFAEDSLWRFSPTGNKVVYKERSPLLTPVVAEDYVKNILIQRVASMHSSPSRALRAVKEIASSSISRGLNIDEVSRELVYRDKVEKRFRAAWARYGENSEEELLIDLMDRSSDHTRTPRNSPQTKVEEFPLMPRPHALAPQVTLVNPDCRYRGSRELHNEDRAPFIAAVDSSPDTERPNIDPDDEAQRIWQEIKMRQRGVSSGSIKRRSVRSKRVASFYEREQLGDRINDREDMLSTVYSAISTSREERELDSEDDVERRMINEQRCRSRQETLHSLVTLRDVRETDFGPWAL